ncbi:MAG: type IV toxin-antitoxin system AbiEi family antitoxin domain-containing protein [Leifsonia sp.]
MLVHHVVHAAGGLVSTADIRRHGLSAAQLQTAVRGGEIFRVRKGWYACPEVPISYREAARVGGRLTSTSAAAANGVWTPPGEPLHVALPHNACRPRTRDSSFRRARDEDDGHLALHWNDDRRGGHKFLVPTAAWVGQVIDDLQPAFAAAVIDSAIRSRVLRRSEWHTILHSLPAAKRSGLAVVDGVPETGTESIVRYALGVAGVVARPQFTIGHRRGDLLVGDRLLLEIDSEEHHGGRSARVRDARRDRELVSHGLLVVHFDYTEVIYEVSAVVAEVLALVRSGVHLRPSV